MSFEVSADAYGRFMGRFAAPLAADFVTELGLRPGQRALDVGCGPGALTALLVEQLGSAHVVAVDPSAPFVAAARERFPGVQVHLGTAEALPLPTDSVDVAAAALVVHFMPDPIAGLAEMRRVTRPGGLVAASCWDFAGNRSPLSIFWEGVRRFEPAHPGEDGEPGARQGQLGEYFRAAGLAQVRESTALSRVALEDFQQWWAPFELGVGPAGSYLAGLDAAQRADLRAACEALFPPTPYVLEATAWTAFGLA